MLYCYEKKIKKEMVAVQFNLYQDVKAFYQDTYHILLRHETQNMIPLGNLMVGNESKDKHEWRDPAGWLMATVTDEQEVRLTAIMTPPFGITLYATDNHLEDGSLECLIEGLLVSDFSVPGVVSEKSLAERFAEIYAGAKSVGYYVNYSQRIYELIEVKPSVQQIGEFRKAEDKDMAFFPYWMESLAQEAMGFEGTIKSDLENYRYHIKGDLYILEHDGVAVSMAKITRKMENICGIGYVYTPPYFRGKGYASTCVARLSQLALDKGYSKCALYTDLANPTSNSIYQKIGYEPLCDSLEIRFEDIEEKP